jgi:hypothetical protein
MKRRLLLVECPLVLESHFVGAGPTGKFPGALPALIIQQALLIEFVKIVGGYSVPRFVFAQPGLKGMQVLKSFGDSDDSEFDSQRYEGEKMRSKLT